MRAFLGIPIHGDLKDKIILAQKRFSQFDIKFVEPVNFHFNLKFFSELEEGKIEDVKAAVSSACRKYRPFDIKIAGVGAFPSKERARVVWLGVDLGNENLVSLGDSIQKELQNIGFEGEIFTPHLTLGRVRSFNASLSKHIEELEDFEAGIMKVEKIVLFQSTLCPSGPVYGALFNVLL